MNALLTFALRLVVPAALALQLDYVGSADPSVNAMWSQIKTIFPNTSAGQCGMWVLLIKGGVFILEVIGGAAVVVIVYGGIKMATSGGDESKFGEGKKIATYALIGVALAVMTDVIMRYVRYVLIPGIAGGGALGGSCSWF